MKLDKKVKTSAGRLFVLKSFELYRLILGLVSLIGSFIPRPLFMRHQFFLHIVGEIIDPVQK